MPLVFHRKLNPIGELGLWKIEEPASFFLDQLSLVEEEQAQIAPLNERRLKEWASGRYLLHLMSGRKFRGACLKDEFGKPYLLDSLFEISISHSGAYVAVIAAPHAVGVDVQKVVGKIERIAHKYMRTEELASLETSTRLDHLHVYWGLKESLYKAYGRKALRFKENIISVPFTYDLAKGICEAEVQKDDFQQSFQVYYEKFDNYILVYALAAHADERLA
ncbi:MAG: 4'-phosphopantetheinyl transferase superfamily protein [Saprospiraceae bacterium]